MPTHVIDLRNWRKSTLANIIRRIDTNAGQPLGYCTAGKDPPTPSMPSSKLDDRIEEREKKLSENSNRRYAVRRKNRSKMQEN
jgi:hypothetical protein